MGHHEGVFMVIRLGRKLSFRSLLHTGLEQVLKSTEQGFPIPDFQQYISAIYFKYIYLKGMKGAPGGSVS